MIILILEKLRDYIHSKFSCPWDCGAEFETIEGLNNHIYTCTKNKGQR